MLKIKLSFILAAVFLYMPLNAVMTSDKALDRLMQGNQDYIMGNFRVTNRAAEEERRRQISVYGQNPFAAILGDSDSRSAPEIIFNKGIGDIFVVRTSGGIAGNDQIASLEFAIDHLGVPLVMVLGHTQYGVVNAAISGTRERGALGRLLRNIARPVRRKTDAIPEDERFERGMILHIEHTVRTVKASRRIKAAMKEGRVEVVGAIHNIRTGEVRLLK